MPTGTTGTHPLIPAEIEGFANINTALGYHPDADPLGTGGFWREYWGPEEAPVDEQGNTSFGPIDQWVLLAGQYGTEGTIEKPFASRGFYRWYPNDLGAAGLEDYFAWYDPYGSTSPTLGLLGGFTAAVTDPGGPGPDPGTGAAPSLGIRKPLPEGSFTGIRRRNISIAFPHSPDLFSPESGLAGAPTNLLERPTDIDLVEPDPREITTTSGSTRGTPRVGL